MKQLYSFLFALFCSITTMSAAGNVKFTVSGIQQGDAPIVTLESSAYLNSLAIEKDGDYSFDDVPTGKYYIKIEASGYNIPAAQIVIVNEDGSIEPIVGIKISITKMSENPDEWTHS